MARSLAREVAMQLVYERLMGGGSELTRGQLIETPLSGEDESFVQAEVDGVYAHLDEIDTWIEKNAQGWSLARFSRVDLSILRIAVYELLFRKDIPTAASINEAVELSHTFSTAEAGPFINGVLGSIARAMPKEA